MTTVTVSGFATADIHAAIAAAGAGGTLLFPAGTYNVDNLVASVADQTWLLERYAVIKKVAAAIGPIILLTADGLRIRGGVLDGNRGNCPVGDGIDSTGFSLDMRDCIMRNVSSWGVAIQDAALDLRDCLITNTKNACVIWRATGPVLRQGPFIDHCTFDRAAENPVTVQSGCVLIQSTASAQYVMNPRVTNCTFRMPYPTEAADADHLEFLWCQRALVFGNLFYGGRIGMTYGNCGYGIILANLFQGPTSYMIELGCNDTNVQANNGSGNSPTLDGISVNPIGSSNIKAVGNILTGCTRAAVFDPNSKITVNVGNS